LSEKIVNGLGGLSPFGDRPHDERLPARHVSGGEHLADIGLVVRRRNVAARVHRHAKLRDDAGLRGAHETHRQEHQISGQFELRARDLFELAVDKVHVHRLERADFAIRRAQSSLVITPKSREPPSSCDDEVLKI